MLKMRLSMGGTKKRPVYKIVVADSRFARDGRFIEKLGFFNPLLPKDKKERVGLDTDRIKYWLEQGAQPTTRVARILGEKEDVKSCKHITSQSNQELITTDIKVSNVDHSCMFLMSEDKSKLLKNPNDRKSKLNLFMHCTASHNKYYPETFSIIKDYVLDQFPDTMIYGKWEKELPNVKEIPMIDLHDVLYDTKYTLTIGGSNNYPTASKFWKMLIFGIIPFCYKEIDIEKFNIPEFLYVKNPEDLKNKIDYLENNIDFYNNLWYDLQNIILNDDLWNGNTFFGNIEKWIKAEFGYDIERKGTITHRTSSLFVKEKTNTLQSNDYSKNQKVA